MEKLGGQECGELGGIGEMSGGKCMVDYWVDHLGRGRRPELNSTLLFSYCSAEKKYDLNVYRHFTFQLHNFRSRS